MRAYDARTGAQGWAWDLGIPAGTNLPPEGQTCIKGTPNDWDRRTGVPVKTIDEMLCRILFRSYRYDGDFTTRSTKRSIIYPGNNDSINWGSAKVDQERNILITADMRMPVIACLGRPWGNVTAGDLTTGEPVWQDSAESARNVTLPSLGIQPGLPSMSGCPPLAAFPAVSLPAARRGCRGSDEGVFPAR